MAKNYVSSGETVEIPAPTGGVRAGKVYKIGDLTLIASTDGKEGDLVSFYTRGVFDFPKAASAIAAGAKIYWKGTSNNVDGSGASSDPLIGVALMEAAASSSTVKVLFRGF